MAEQLAADRSTGRVGSTAAALPPGIQGIALATDDDLLPIAGSVGSVFDLSTEDELHLASGEAVLRVERDAASGEVFALMGLPVATADSEAGVLWGRITGDSIWASAVTRASEPTIADLCILGASNDPLYCGAGAASLLPVAIASRGVREGAGGQLEVDGADGGYLAS